MNCPSEIFGFIVKRMCLNVKFMLKCEEDTANFHTSLLQFYRLEIKSKWCFKWLIFFVFERVFNI